MKQLFILILLLGGTQVLAQKGLSTSPKQAPFTYVYRIPDQALLDVYKSKKHKQLPGDFMTRPVDSFRTADKDKHPLPPGNFLLVTANHQVLERQVKVVHNIFINVLNNNEDLLLTLHTLDGKQVSEAEVHLGKKTIPYDKNLHAYYLRKYHGKGGLVQVKYQEVMNFFRVNPYAKDYSYRTRSYDNTFQETGYLSFNKPKYKPNDTVKLKSFIVDKKGVPVNEDLALRLYTYDGSTDTILAVLHPYRPGGFEYQFPMKDSMKLDMRYNVSLEPADKPAKNRKKFIYNNFYFEEYELQKIRLSASVNKTSTQRNEPVLLTINATDENGLPLLDARAKIIITPNSTPDRYNTSHVFLADTMYNKTMPIETLGPTIVQLPDSIFPSARFSYTITCQLLNSENETTTYTFIHEYTDDVKKLDIEEKEDSLYMNMLTAGKPVPDTATLYLYDGNNNLISSSHLQLPATISLAPHVVSYEISSDTMHEKRMVNDTHILPCESRRTSDSIYFNVDNPRHTPFWYTIYENKKIVERGYTQSLNWQKAASPKLDYYLQLHYIRGNQVLTDTYNEKYQEKKLHVAIKAPATIAPGQESQIEIAVSDQQGKPVRNADVTAYSYTGKFQNSSVAVPYLGRDRPDLSFKNQYTQKEVDNYHHNMYLNFGYWESRMRLDTILWYQFTHPAPVFRYDENAVDAETQLAPFVFVNGFLRNPGAIYIDRMPVYYSDASQQKIYSFRTNPGTYTIQIRTNDMLITIDSFIVHMGVKNFVSIDPLSQAKHVTVEKMSDKYSAAEARVLNHYFINISHNYGDRFSYVRQNKNIYLLSARYGNPENIVGPLTGEPASLVVHEQFEQNFDPEEGYSFNISPGLIKQKQKLPVLAEGDYVHPGNNDDVLEDQVLTPSMLTDYTRIPSRPLLTTDRENSSYAFTGRLELELPVDTINTHFYTLLFRDDEPSFIRVIRPGVTIIKGLREGKYRLMFLYNDNRFSMQDSIYIKKDGINFYRLPQLPLLPTTAISRQDSLLIKNRRNGSEKYLGNAGSIRGVVKDQNGVPLPGVTITCGGTTFGCFTNQFGEFTLQGVSMGIIKAMYIGYKTLEVVVKPKQRYYELIMEEDSKALSEVVVTGYGISHGSAKKKKMKYDDEEALSDNRSYYSNLYDSKNADKMDEPRSKREIANIGFFNPDKIGTADIPMLDTALSTGMSEAPAPFQLRSHFNDAAFWQPKLATDASGTASFSTTFPDDITNWRVFALVMNDQQQSGQAESSIRAFKPVSANLALPNFAVEGDSIHIIGKALNYTSDSLQISRTFKVNDNIRLQRSGKLVHALIDTLNVGIPARDSLRFNYTIDNRDGEERSIPVFHAGTRADTGFFACLLKDTTLTFAPGLKGPVHVYAEAAILPVLMKEMKYVQHYKYLCNEQLASKLKAYLLEKKAKAYLNEKFEHNKDIRTILSRLKRTQYQGMWGWWEHTTPSIWISLHVVEALQMAQEEGYETNINTETLADDLLSSYHRKDNIDSIGCLMMLSKLKAKVDFATLTSEIYPRNGYDSLRLLLLKQREHLPVNLKPILARQQSTVFGNAYWGQFSYDLFHSSISQTLLVYKLLRATGGHEQTLQKIRGYFLEERRNGQWRNTYESSAILETILPDLLKAEAQGKASLQVNGYMVTRFPFDTVITAASAVTFARKGGMPLYLTATQEYWDASPDAVAKTFEVSSKLDQPVLETGKKVGLTVNVYAKGDADYVMIEIPIPAGCSYAGKPQPWYNSEVHREYGKEMVSIFCSTLYRGMHTFTIELMPRYSGKYILNPAKATMQYFPLFMGRTGLKKVIIQ
ncbi:alpha-2-macroglobulin family protein [Chitinophaga silvisoli]|uniref:Alpha-2-macroglobulin domain-containing protein n=1 Tax=Chitinophaga silvisoli TaxID=2291814 RepID=A0A3E1P0N7_9BACT|nr:alpha-2-macroglobulin family protein [Chitinophaga silvisoli]RFM33739.1 hypothetical protein DXN04_17410 [Chitinophaga silvisoli]